MDENAILEAAEAFAQQSDLATVPLETALKLAFVQGASFGVDYISAAMAAGTALYKAKRG